MSNSIDQRIVEMKFDNAQFEKGIEETIKSLDSLDESLGVIDSKPVSDGISGLIDSIGGLDGVAEKIDSGRSKIAQAFEVLSSTVGKFTVIGAGITAGFAALQAAFNFQGGWNRALNLENAKFQLKGLGIAWEDVSGSINAAVDGTAYGLDAAASAASQFAASGVALGEDMTRALGGISGAAAMTNSSYEDIANIFTRVAGQGKVMASDLNSLASRGLNAAAIMADAWGTTEQAVRDMVSSGEVGFNDFANVMYEKFYPLAKEANSTFNGALSNMNAAWSRFWAQFLVPAEEGGAGILDMLRRIFLSIRTVVNAITKTFAPIAQQMAPFTDAIASFFETVASAFESAMVYTDEAGTHLTWFAEQAGQIFGYLIDLVSSLVRPFVAFFKAVLPSFEEFYNWIASIRDVNFIDRLALSEGLVQALETAMSALGSVIKGILGPAITFVTNVIDKLVVAFIFVKDALDTFFDALWDFAKNGADAFSKAFGEVKNPLESLVESFNNSEFMNSELGKHVKRTGELFGELWDIINGAASGNYMMPWEEIGAKIGEITDHLFGFLKVTGRTELSENLQNNFFTPFVNTIKGIWNLITGEGGADLVFSGLGHVFSSIANGFAEFAGVIGGVLADVAGVILEGLSYVFEIISGIGSGVIDFFSTVISNIGVLGTSFVDGIVEGLGGDNIDAAASTFENGMNTVVGSAAVAGNALANSPIGELVSGIGEAFGEFGEAAKDHAPTVQDWGNLFNGLNTSIGKFVAWLDPIGRMKALIEGLKEAFKDFGTDAFEGWGSKFLGDGSGIANLLDTVSTSLSNLWKAILENLPTGDEVAAAIGSLAEGVVWLINTLAPLFEGLGRIIGTVGRDAIEFFAGLGEKLASFGGGNFSGIGDFFSNLFESFNQFSKDFASGDVNVFETIGGFFENVVKFIQTIGEAIFGTGSEDTLNAGNEVITGVSDFCSMFNDLKDPVNAASSVAQEITGQFEQIGSDVQNGTGLLGQALSWAQNNIVTIVGAVAGGAMFIAVYRAVKSFRKVEESLSGMLDGISGLAEAIKNKIDPPKQSILTQIRNFILALAALAVTFIIISLIPKDSMIESLVIIGILAAVLVGVIFAVSLINKKLGTMNIGEAYGMAAVVAAIAAAVLLMSVSLALIAMIPPDRAGIAAGIIAGLMAGIALIARAIATKINAKVGTQMLAAAAGLMVLGLAMLEFVGIIAIFTIIPWGELIPGIIAAVAELSVLTFFANRLGKNSGNMIKAASAIMAMGAAMLVLTASILLLEAFRNETTDYVQDAIVLIGLLASLVAAIAVLDNIRSTATTLQHLASVMQQMGTVMLAISASLAIVEIFSNDTGEMIAAMASLVLVLASMTAALLVLQKLSGISGSAVVLYEIAGALLVVSAAMAIVSAAISGILDSEATWDRIAAAAISMSVSFGIMAAALAIMTGIASVNTVGIIVAASAMVVMAAAMWVLADGLNSMQNVSWDNVWQLIAILTAMTIAGAIAGFLFPISIGMLAISASALMLGNAVLAAGTGIEKFSIGLSILSRTMVPFVEELDEAMGKFATTMKSRFPEVIDAFISNLQDFASRMPELISSIATAVTSVIVGIAEGIAESVPKVADALLDMMESAVEWMSENGERLSSAVQGFASVLGEMIGNAILAIPSLIGSLIGTVVDGIGNLVSSHAQEMANKTVDEYINAYSAAASKMSVSELETAMTNLANASMGELSISGSFSTAGYTTSWNEATKAAQEYSAMVQRIYEDEGLKKHFDEIYAAEGGFDAVVRKLEQALGVNLRWTEALEDTASATEDAKAKADALHVSYGTWEADLSGVYDMLMNTDAFSNLNISAEQFGEILSNIGNGDLLSGLNIALGDSTALADGLKSVLGEETVAALESSGVSIDMLQQALTGATDGAEYWGQTLNSQGEDAKYTLEEVSAALANGVDVGAALESMDRLREGIYQTRDAFNEINVGAVSAFNTMSVDISSKIAGIQSSVGRLSSAVTATFSTMAAKAQSGMSAMVSQISSGVSRAASAMRGLSSAVSGINLYSQGYSVGYQVASGMAAGMSSGTWLVTIRAYALARAAYDAARNALGIESPSKEFMKIGQFSGQGFALGLTNSIGVVTESVDGLASSATDALRLSMSSMGYMLDGIDWDANPVIRPVLDTSGIESGMSFINSMFGASPTMQAAYAHPGAGRIFTGGSPRIYHISVDLNYEAGDDGVALANGLVSRLEDYANLEG